MDPLTHGLMGASLRGLGFLRKGSLPVLIIASILPDMDYLALLKSKEAFAYYHRGITHGAAALFTFPLIIGLLSSLFSGGLRKGFLYFFAMAFLGVLGHLSLDVMNNYGIKLFTPLSEEYINPGFIYYIDPVVACIFGFSLYLARFSRAHAFKFAALAFLVLLAYAGGRFWLQQRAVEFVRTQMPDAVVRSVTPLPMSQSRWWFVVETRDGIKTGYADLYSRGAYVHATYPPNPPLKAYESARRLPIVRHYLNFSKSPAIAASREDGNLHFTLRELSFSHEPRERFTLSIVIDPEGRVLKQKAVF